MNAKELRIVYMGTPDFAVMPLRTLVESGYNIVGVITVPDKPAGRGLKLQESAVKKYAREVRLNILQPQKLREREFLAEFERLQPDLGIVIAFRMLPEVVWQMPKLGTFNLHASLLPQYRGAAPINWAIINGETKTGVTTFMLNAEIDKGAILGQKEVVINKEDTAGILHDRLMITGTALVVDTVEKLAADKIVPEQQKPLKNELLREAPKLFKETCRIEWQKPIDEVYNLIRGLSPHPTAWSNLVSAAAAELNIKIFSADKLHASHDLSPGTILSDGKTYFKIAVPGGYIDIHDLQLAGKKRMKVADFLRGFNGIENFRME